MTTSTESPRPFDREAWLARIGHPGPVPATPESLTALHRAQVYTIPFENFDLLLGRGIDLSADALFSKLVERRRGGYCFELNSLLLRALLAFGFDARPLLARVHTAGTPTGRTHMLLLVMLNERPWIADAGFGGPGLRAPIPLELDRTADQDGQTFRLVRSPPWGIMLQTWRDEAWRALYSFDSGHVTASDIELGNHFTATHSDSFFTYARVAALPRPGGRCALYDLRLTTTEDGVEQTRLLNEGPDFLQALEQEFGIVLDCDYEAIRPLATNA